MKQLVEAGGNDTNIVVFLSDGQSNFGGFTTFTDNLAELAATGAVAHSFAIGASSSCDLGTNGTLQAIADLSPWQGVTGTIRWDPTGQNTRPVTAMATVRDGELVAD